MFLSSSPLANHAPSPEIATEGVPKWTSEVDLEFFDSFLWSIT